jgi:hypothetical protein
VCCLEGTSRILNVTYRMFKKSLYLVAGLEHAETGNMVNFCLGW